MNELLKTQKVAFSNYEINELAINSKTLSFTRSQDTKDTYRKNVTEYNAFLKANSFTFNQDSLKNFVAYLKDKNNSMATIVLKLRSIKAIAKNQRQFKNNLVAQAVIDQNFKNLTKFTADKKILNDKYLTKEEVYQMMAVANKRNALIVEFLFKTALRVSEMINVKLADIELNSHAKVNVVGKGSKERSVFISVELLYRIKQTFAGQRYLFETHNHTQLNRINVHREIKRLGKKARIKKNVHPHTLRHSYLMYLKTLGKDAKYRASVAGHSSTAITQDMYDHGGHGEEMAELVD